MEKIISIIGGIGICFIIFLFLACGAIALAMIYAVVGFFFLIFLITKGEGTKKLPPVFLFLVLVMILSVLAPATCQSAVNPNPLINQEECQSIPSEGYAVLTYEGGKFFAYISGGKVRMEVSGLPQKAYENKNRKIITSEPLRYHIKPGLEGFFINFFSDNPEINRILEKE
jgi:hypothetical protein